MEARAVPVRARSRSLTYRQQEALWAYLFVTPLVIGLICFTFGPTLAGLALAFFNTNLITQFDFVGLDNFQRILRDNVFWTSVANTAKYALGSIPPGIIISLAMAIALNQKIRGRAFYRTLFFLPVVTPVVSTSLVWAWAYHTEFGIFNYLLGQVGIGKVAWLTSSDLALWSIIIWSVWAGLGYYIILFLAGLQGVPTEVVDAAKVDGAGNWQTFRHVTLPLLTPTLFFVVVLGIIGSFQVFTQTYVMTKGGPGYSTYTIVLYLFNSGWTSFRFGYASAVAVMLGVALALVTLMQFRLQRRWVHYEK